MSYSGFRRVDLMISLQNRICGIALNSCAGGCIALGDHDQNLEEENTRSDSPRDDERSGVI